MPSVDAFLILNSGWDIVVSLVGSWFIVYLHKGSQMDCVLGINRGITNPKGMYKTDIQNVNGQYSKTLKNMALLICLHYDSVLM